MEQIKSLYSRHCHSSWGTIPHSWARIKPSFSRKIYSSSSPWLRANGRANSSASTHVKECIDFAFVDQWIGAELCVPDWHTEEPISAKEDLYLLCAMTPRGLGCLEMIPFGTSKLIKKSRFSNEFIALRFSSKKAHWINSLIGRKWGAFGSTSRGNPSSWSNVEHQWRTSQNDR